MAARDRCHRVNIQSLVPVQDDTTGAITNTWVLFATVWASIDALTVREFAQAASLQSKVTDVIGINYLAGVKPSMRVVCADRTFNIEGVLRDPHSGIEDMLLPCSEIING